VRYAEAIATSAIETSDFLRGDLLSAQIGAAQQGRTKKLSFNKRPIRFYLHAVNASRARVALEEGAPERDRVTVRRVEPRFPFISYGAGMKG
jgi:hypothetical protein